MYANEKTPINNGQHEISVASNKCTQIIQTNNVSSRVLPCQLPPKELNPGNFTLPCTIGSLNIYVMADLGASVNVIPKSIFEHLELAQLKKTDMLVEMADMTKRSPVGIVENVLVKIDKFLFPSDFVVMDMLNTRNETMILGRPFLATIHAKIDVFSASSRVEETNDVHNENNYCNQEQGRSLKYEENQEKGLIWDERFEEWCINNPNTPTSRNRKERTYAGGYMGNYRKVQGDNTYWWHDQKSEEEERQKLGIDIKEYDPPMDLMDALPLGRENGSRFRDMIRKEVDSGRRIRRKT
ncbi:reverse transcriptase domain-containing protein [Tanacetum coccineum]